MMADQEPKEQFEATEYDEKDNIIPPAPAIATKKPKRMTVADLKKEIDRIDDKIDDDALTWLGELDSRLNHLEVKLNDVPPTFAHDVITRLDNQDAMIDTITGELRSHLEEPAAATRPSEPELEFAQPPVQTAGETDDISDMAVVACVCQTMTDVLTVTRALKIVPELTDAERNEILHIACRASGVVITPGLQIRAGVRNVEA